MYNDFVANYYENYSPVGDILVLASCIVFLILIFTAYINHTKNFLIFRNIVFLLIIAASSDLFYHIFSQNINNVPHIAIYITRGLFHLGLFGNLQCYVLYACETLHLTDKNARSYPLLAFMFFGLLLLYEILGTVLGFGFCIDADDTIRMGINIFPFGCFLYLALLMFIVIKYRTRVYKQIFIGVISSSVLSLVVMLIQIRYGQSSFTTATFLFPAYAILYLIHSNPYDPEIGAINITAFEDYVAYNHSIKRELLIMSLFLPSFDVENTKFPVELQSLIRYYNHHFFRKALLFQISGGHIILVAQTAKNPDHQRRLQAMLDDFYIQHKRFGYDHKIVFMTSLEEISAKNDYIGLIQYLEANMREQEVKYVNESDIEAYRKHKYLIRELEDISFCRDLNDPRVEVFCQPVFNISTGKYDTAEALMRLRLDKLGMVFPDQFIPIAEKYNYIQILSLIILGKTCMTIKKMLDNGYNVKRISVNFSMIDVREANFCNNVIKIVSDSGIPFDKIAIELTESQSEKDFIIIRDKINELKESGIKFYLDDFGTGYSNFDRIIELPFDIIKFDRSLVLASGADVKSETMVSYLAHMFSDLHYSVLYEGIETAEDENMCINMCARYLQGYKYSKPIPIEKLTDYFEKTVEHSATPVVDKLVRSNL